jgi:methionyl-tRNA formyltransferase
MNYKDVRIVFMGTPAFAVASLNELVEAGCNIVGVITAPDKPAGRGMELQQSEVKKYSIEKGLKVLQPTKLKDEIFLEELRSLKADMQIVVAFRMLPEVVWNMPSMGTINLHGSLLPQYRGAAPINWAIINGEKTTGVTTFKLQHEIDTGDILMSELIDIDENETAGSLHDKMKIVGAKLLLKTVKLISEEGLIVKPQSTIIANDELSLKHAPKIFTETCKIDWQNSGKSIIDLIRGLSPYPAAFSFMNEKKLKIFEANFIEGTHTLKPGEIETDQKSFLRFACNDGFINVKDIQLEGKKRMQIEDFLRGYRF